MKTLMVISCRMHLLVLLALLVVSCNSAAPGLHTSKPKPATLTYRDTLRLTIDGRSFSHIHVNHAEDRPDETWQQKFDAFAAEIHRQHPDYPPVRFLLQKKLAETRVPGWKAEVDDGCWFDAYLDGYRALSLICYLMKFNVYYLENGIHIAFKKDERKQPQE